MHSSNLVKKKMKTSRNRAKYSYGTAVEQSDERYHFNYIHDTNCGWYFEHNEV